MTKKRNSIINEIAKLSIKKKILTINIQERIFLKIQAFSNANTIPISKIIDYILSETVDNYLD